MAMAKSTKEQGVEVAPIPFRILKYCGLWRPTTSLPPLLNAAYTVYTCMMLAVLITIALLVLIAVCRMSFTDEHFAENVFLMFALCNANFKAVNVLLSRARFLKLLDMLSNPRWSEARSPDEIEIQRKYSQTTRKISVYFTWAVFIAIVLRCIAPLLDTSGEVMLPVDAYCPCDIRKPRCYWTLYWHQAIGTGVATLIHAAKDCLINAFLLQTCAQLEILKHRLLSVTEHSMRASNEISTRRRVERKLIAKCIRDHQSIFEFANVLNGSLSVMLFGQIAVTIPNLCLSIYLLSNQSITSMEFMMTTQFFSAVVIELFFFCWYGNEVTLHSLDVESAISAMDWTSLASDGSRKDLLMMMVRATKPILFSVGPIMNMKIDSFLSIMKTSYSAFSVLQTTD